MSSVNKFGLKEITTFCSYDGDYSYYYDQAGVTGSVWQIIYDRKEKGRKLKNDRQLTFDILIRNHSPKFATEEWRSEYSDRELKDCFGLKADLRGYYIEVHIEINKNGKNGSYLHAEQLIGSFETYDEAFYEMRFSTCEKYGSLTEKELYKYYELHWVPENLNSATYYFPILEPTSDEEPYNVDLSKMMKGW